MLYLSYIRTFTKKNSLRVVKLIYEKLVVGGIIRIVLPDIDKFLKI